MFNKAVVLFLIPVSIHSMHLEETRPLVPQTGYNNGADGLTKPGRGVAYQAHNFKEENIDGEPGEDNFVGIVSQEEQKRRDRKARRDTRDAALDLQKKQRQEVEDNCAAFQGLFVEGDAHSFDDEMVYPNEYGAPVACPISKRSPTQFELEFDKEVAEMYKQVAAFFGSMWICGS